VDFRDFPPADWNLQGEPAETLAALAMGRKSLFPLAQAKAASRAKAQPEAIDVDCYT
jgi:hypothetical protein